MKKYIKGLIKRIIITLALIIIPIILIEISIDFFDEDIKWIEEDKLINQMNKEKIANCNWGENGLWLHKNENLSPKKEGTKRIFIVGDSFVWGDGYSNANHIWWKQFKHLLKEEGYDNVEVVASGIGGYSTKNELEYILKDKELIKLVDPDLIIIGYVSNDPDTIFFNYNEVLINYDFDREGIVPGTKLLKKYLPNIYMKLSISMCEKFGYSERFKNIFGYSYYDWIGKISTGESFAYYDKEVVDPLIKYINEELNVPFICYMTMIDGTDPNIRDMEKLFRSKNIETYYFIDEAEKRNIEFDKNNQKINPANGHPSVEIARAYAECILDILKEKHNDVLGSKGAKYVPKFEINDWMPYLLLPEKIDDKSYYINYPDESLELSFLSLPVSKKYIKLNLGDPLNISEISLECDGLEKATIWVNTINKDLGFDDQVMLDIGTKKDIFTWNLDRDLEVTSININAKISSKYDRKIKITVR